LCDHAIKLTRALWSVIQADIDRLRTVGLTDRAINDASQVVSFFNYINRVTDGLGVDLEQGMPIPGQRTRSPAFMLLVVRADGSCGRIRRRRRH
jgi:uncharacterized protein YciW